MTTQDNLERALHAAENGALVLTSNTRAARNLKREFAERQRAAGHEVWQSPDILPWSAWLKRLWQEQIYRAPGRFVALLDEAQEQLVWERIVAADRGNPDASSIAEECSRAWRLLHAFRLPRTRAAFQRKKDSTAFFQWAESYAARCLQNGWLDEARLSDAVRDTAISECSGRKVLLWGFDRFTPQQQELLNGLEAAGILCDPIQADGQSASPLRIELEDFHAELRASASWARALLEKSPTATIGIVVPNLQEIRGTVERIFIEVLHPDALTIENSDRNRAFDISVGPPLAHTPAISAALMLLEIAAGRVSLEKASRLLRTPFVGDAEELGARSLLDTQIRAAGITEVTLNTFLERANLRADVTHFATSIRRYRDAVAKFPKRQMPSRWSREVIDLLSTAGWPGSRSQSSAEYQARRAFVDLLGKFARFDLVLEPIDFATMFRRLRALAESTLFQPENLGAPIQIVGMIEAAGSHFDRLWVLGLHADAWPPPPNPSPFLPLELQRSAGATGSTSEERLEYARQVTNRTLRSASDVIFSSPLREGDQELRVSPLLANFPEMAKANSAGSGSRSSAAVLFSKRQTDSLLDESGPALQEPRTKGGTKVFQLQAACPFRAFAELRLGAKELEMPRPGMDNRVRGGLLHDALKLTWEELQSSNNLRAKSQVELEEVVRHCVDRALNQSDTATLTGWEQEVAKLERQRLTGLILSLLAEESQRFTPFRIHQLEEKEDIQFGGVATDVKVDRVDVLEDTRYVLLDYKSGEPNLGTWDTDRPDEPQLPIYATQLKDKLAAVAFVQLTKGNICFKGYAKDERLLPGLRAFDTLSESKRPQPSWEELLNSWEQTLHRLGKNFREGRAQVDPKKPSTCTYCHLGMLCRIDEAPPAPTGDEDE